jgi:hypothetical protein
MVENKFASHPDPPDFESVAREGDSCRKAHIFKHFPDFIIV